MRRTHRLALSALAALLALAVAGRLATSFAARGAGARDGVAAHDATDAAARAAARVAEPAVAGPQRRVVASATPTVSTRAAATGVASEAPRSRADRPGAGAPIALDDPQRALGVSLAVAGRDSGAPRSIELWRIDGARAVRVATGTSRADGSLALPAYVLPAGDVTLVASPRGEGADSPNASAPVVARRDPSAPQLVALEEVAADALLVTVAPAEPGGSVLIARAPDQELGRTAVVAGAEAAPSRLEIAVALTPDDTEILFAQEIPDGRRSPWRHVARTRKSRGE